MIVKFSPFDKSKPCFEPVKGSQLAAGWDVFASEDTYVFQGTPSLVPTNLKLEFNSDGPLGVYCRIAPRSGLAIKGIDVMAGVVDADYRGEVKVVLSLLGGIGGPKQYHFKSGEKIAQLIFEPFYKVQFERTHELSSTQRGEGGFGSTDKKD